MMYGLMDYYKLNVALTEEDVSCAEWDKLSRTASQASRDLIAGVLSEAHRLARPEAVCKAVPVEKTAEGQIFLSGGRVLTSSLLARLAGPSECMILVICTLGKAIDRRVDEYNREGHAARAYFLDIAGTCIIEAAGRQLTGQIRKQAGSRGYKTTIPLGPGHSYWNNLPDQHVIYDLLTPSKIGVSILKSGMMLPKKTLSMVMGIGCEVPPSAENHCYYCSMGQNCPLSRAGGPA